MTRKFRRISTIAALCAALAPACATVSAQSIPPWNLGQIGPSGAQVYGAIAGVAGALALTGILTYRHIKHNHNLTGCAQPADGGMTLTTDSDKQTYTLTGEVAGIKPGERVRVSGKKTKHNSTSSRPFLVEKVTKDYGACTAPPPMH